MALYDENVNRERRYGAYAIATYVVARVMVLDFALRDDGVFSSASGCRALMVPTTDRQTSRRMGPLLLFLATFHEA